MNYINCKFCQGLTVKIVPFVYASKCKKCDVIYYPDEKGALIAQEYRVIFKKRVYIISMWVDANITNIFSRKRFDTTIDGINIDLHPNDAKKFVSRFYKLKAFL
jgi:hypothetical protein